MPPSTGLAQLVLSSNVNGQFAQNVLHAEISDVSADSPFAVALAVLEGWVSTMQDFFQACIPASTVLLSARCRLLTPGGGPFVTRVAGIGGTLGTRTGDPIPGQVAPVIIFPAPSVRWVNGKIFIPGLSEDDVHGNILSADLITSLQTFGVALAAGWDLIGVSARAAYVVKEATTDSYTAPVGVNVSPRIGTQRRRLAPIV